MSNPTSKINSSASSYPSQQESSSTQSCGRGYAQKDSLNDNEKNQSGSISCFDCLWTALRNFLAYICPCFCKEESENPPQNQQRSENTIPSQTLVPSASSSASSSNNSSGSSSSTSALSIQSPKEEGSQPSEAEAFIEQHKQSLFKHYKKGTENPALTQFKMRSPEVQIAILSEFSFLKGMKMQYIISYLLVSKSKDKIEAALRLGNCKCSIRELKEPHCTDLQKDLLKLMGNEEAPSSPYPNSSASPSSSTISTQNPQLSQDSYGEFVNCYNSQPQSAELQLIFKNCKEDADKSKILSYLIQRKASSIEIVTFVTNDDSFLDKVVDKLGKQGVATPIIEALKQDPTRLPSFLDFTK